MNYVYILRCADGTLYTGWTNDLTRRLAAHNSGRGAKYTRGRGPVTLAFSEVFGTQREAMGYEASIKKLSLQQKQGLIAAQDEPGGEYLTVYDAALRPCGERPRSVVHRQGLLHMVTHLWLLEGDRLWLQQRAADRPLYPGLFDLAATGHIDPGETPVQAVCREAREEGGIEVRPEQLLSAGAVSQRYPRPDGFDDEIAHAFVLRTQSPPVFRPGPEVARMAPLALDEYARGEAAFRRGESGGVRFSTGETVALDAFCCWHAEEWALVQALLSANG